MSPLQWAFMATALQKLEEAKARETSAYFEHFRQILISVLGLRINGFRNEDGSLKDPKTITEEDLKQFTPLVFFVGRPEILQSIQEEYKKDQVASTADQDQAFEQLSAAMAADATMEPVGISIEPINTLLQKSVAWKEAESRLVINKEPPKFVGDPGRPRQKVRLMKKDK